MSPKSSVQNSDFISLAQAVLLVSYSRDYIGRLARAEKIISKQEGKQWLVSERSLVNFFEQSTLEDSVRKRILSLSRKNDLLARDLYTAKVAEISRRANVSGNFSLLLATLIMSGGLLSGLFLHTNAEKLALAENSNLASVLASLEFVPNAHTASVVHGIKPLPGVFSEVVVQETQEKIPMDGGVVLFPSVAERDVSNVTTLFSDAVTVELTSTTTGFVRSADGTRELPFVRVPSVTPETPL